MDGRILRSVIVQRANVTNGAEVRSLRYMIVTVRDRVKTTWVPQVENDSPIPGRTSDSCLRPRWGTSRVQPDQFVRENLQRV